MTFHQAAAISRAATIRLVSDVPVLPNPATASVAVIGLGYVGLPLLAGFAKGGQAIGFDIDERKLNALRHGEDTTGQVNASTLRMTISNSPAPPARSESRRGCGLRADPGQSRQPSRLRPADRGLALDRPEFEARRGGDFRIHR